MNSECIRRAFVGFVILALLIPDSALAYGGPGSIVSGIGALIAAVVAIGAAVVGFFWFPLKRLLHSMRGDGEEREADAASAGESVRDE